VKLAHTARTGTDVQDHALATAQTSVPRHHLVSDITGLEFVLNRGEGTYAAASGVDDRAGRPAMVVPAEVLQISL